MGSVSETNTTVVLVHQPTGTVDLHWNPGTEQLTVTIHLNDLTPLSTHPAHIHQGTCQTAGAILFALKPVVANTLGVGTSQTIIPHVTNGIPARGWSINVHEGPQLASSDQSLPIACTAIGNVRHRPSVLFDFNPTTADQQVSGQAQFSIAHDQLAVNVVVHGLVPGSIHMEHIRIGTCTQQGPVLYPLKNLIAGPDGTATATTVINQVPELPAQEWSVNVYRSATLTDTNAPNFDPLVCGTL